MNKRRNVSEAVGKGEIGTPNHDGFKNFQIPSLFKHNVAQKESDTEEGAEAQNKDHNTQVLKSVKKGTLRRRVHF